jgi:hypothetical protein
MSGENEDGPGDPGAPVSAPGGHRPELVPLIGQRVIVTSGTGGTWSGTLIALVDRPSMVLRLDDGRNVSLPQDREVSAALPAPAVQARALSLAAGALLPAVDELDAAVRAMGTTGEDAGPLRRIAELRARIRQIADTGGPGAPGGGPDGQADAG